MAAVATMTTVAGLGLAAELGRSSVKDGLAGGRTEIVPLALVLGLELGLLFVHITYHKLGLLPAR